MAYETQIQILKMPSISNQSLTIQFPSNIFYSNTLNQFYSLINETNLISFLISNYSFQNVPTLVLSKQNLPFYNTLSLSYLRNINSISFIDYLFFNDFISSRRFSIVTSSSKNTKLLILEGHLSMFLMIPNAKQNAQSFQIALIGDVILIQSLPIFQKN